MLLRRRLRSIRPRRCSGRSNLGVSCVSCRLVDGVLAALAQAQASYVAGSPVPLPLPPFCLLVSYKTLGNYCATLTQNVLNGALPIGNSQARLGGQLHQRYLEFSVDPERGSELPPRNRT